jgi:hypothetical protein
MRKRIVECVLATDMTLHAKEYAYMKSKIEAYNIIEGRNVEKIFENLESINLFNTKQEFLNTMIHTADISNPTKPLHIYTGWVELIMEEFWEQGDKEKNLCLPISFLCDRTSTRICTAQIGFIEGIVSPLIVLVVQLFPGLQFLMENLNINKQHYKRIKEEEDQSLAR